jgi:hypothetical protein
VTLSHPAVSRYIQEKFVPCWESIRPVPKVTIDFGDGRVVHRTLGGNTVIYLCLPDGRPVDAYPGVYTGPALLTEMQATMGLLEKLQAAEACGAPAAEETRRWHQERVRASVASEQHRITFSKAIVESPLLNALGVGRRAVRPAVSDEPGEAPLARAVPPVTDPAAVLEKLSARIEDLSKQPATVERLRAEHAKLPDAKRPTPEQLGTQAIELDSTTNLRVVRPAVHLLFSTYEELPDARACRDAVYRRILHVPVDDPDFGLADALVPGTP